MLNIQKYILRVIILVISTGIFSVLFSKNSIAGAEDTIIDAVDYKLLVREFTVPGTSLGGGGALVVKDNFIVYARAQNDFIGINLNDFDSKNIEQKIDNNLVVKFKDNFLPVLVTNASSLVNSVRYRSPEFIPKIEDLLYYDGSFYCTHTFYDPTADDIFFMVSMLKVGDTAWKTIFKSPALAAPYLAKGTGGAIAAKNGVLYVAIGDFSLDRINGLPNDLAPQNASLPFGKIVSIVLSGNYPSSVFSTGHRNPQGLVFLSDGKLLESEHGPRGGDELNIIEEGGNYGWPYRSLGTKYGTRRLYSDDIPPLLNNRIKFVEPIYAFLPSIAATGLAQLQGFSSKWDGDIILGSLVSQTIFRIRMTDRNSVMFVEPLLVSRRIRKLTQYQDSIFALTDSGTILRITIEK